MKSLAAGASLRTPAPASTTVTLWLGGNSVATAWLAASLGGDGTTGVAAGAPTGLMLKSVLMAASWPSSSQIPTPLDRQLCAATSQRFVREYTERRAEMGARILGKMSAIRAAPNAQSERLNANGVMCRDPGVVRRPAAV